MPALQKSAISEGLSHQHPIPLMIEKFLQGESKEAGRILFENNPLSVICSLVCNHEKQCEGHCILNHKDAPIHISSIENYISEAFLDRLNLEKCRQKNTGGSHLP